MFERFFQSAMAISARLLFASSLVMLIAAIAHLVKILSNDGMTGPSLAQQAGWSGALLVVVYNAVLPAAYLFAASAGVHYVSQLTRR